VEIDRKQAAIILAIFFLVVAGVSAIFVRRQLQPELSTRRAAMRQPESPRAVTHSSAAETRRDYEDYRIIGRRNIFNPPFSEQGTEGKGRKLASPSPKLPPAPLPPIVKGPAPPLPDMSRLSRHWQPGGTSASAPIAATGIVRLDGKPYVLLEQLEEKESAMVGIGESAFGYTLVSIVGENVTLQGERGPLTLSLGQNKKVSSPPKQEEKKPESPPAPTSSPAEEKTSPHPEVTIETSPSPDLSFRVRRFQRRNSEGGRAP